MTRFSANLGFLWTELPLPTAIRAAHTAGFDAVECHWPYDTATAEVNAALTETGLQMLGLNTRRGNVAMGENGLSAVPTRMTEARAAIDEAIAYASAIGCQSIHVMSGVAAGAKAQACFVENLRYAVKNAQPHGITILIEPLNSHDAPGYFLQTTDHAVQLIQEVAAPNLKLMFDCYHVYLTEGNLRDKIAALLSYIGHIQFAGAPGRGTPDTGEVAYEPIFHALDELGYDRPLGAEYKPGGATEPTLGWLTRRTGVIER